MKQLEIKYFWPLTEQVELDLDYTQPQKVSTVDNLTAVNTNGVLSCNIQGFTSLSTFEIKGKDSVGYYELTPGVKIHKGLKPNVFQRIFANLLLGWKWSDANL